MVERIPGIEVPVLKKSLKTIQMTGMLIKLFMAGRR
jgi:hypothetical protein